MKIRAFLCLTTLLSVSFSVLASDLTGDNLLIGEDNHITYGPETAKSAALGLSNNINGIENLVVGEGNYLSYGILTMVLGNGNSQAGENPTDTMMCVGSNNIFDSVGNTLIVGSNNSISSNSSLVAGFSNQISGTLQFALGLGLVSHVQSDALSLYLGQYNVIDASSTPPIFVIGNGTDASHRTNALEVAKDGKVKVNNFLEIYAANYNAGYPNSGKIVIQPSVSGSVITVDGRPLVAPNANGNLYLNSSGAGNVILNASGSGNIGIGTSIPQAKLTVAGNAAIGTGVASAANQVVVGSYNDTRTNDNGVDHTQGVFVVGAGTGSGAGAANAIRVLADGTVLVKKSGNLAMGTFTNGPRP